MEPNTRSVRLTVMGTDFDEPGNAASTGGLSTVRSRGGGISVTCTAAGLPVQIRLEPAQVRREPSALAADVLALCRLAGVAAGVRRRETLAAEGVPDETLALLGLPSRDDVVEAERTLDRDRRR